jgi:hypothetical protein
VADALDLNREGLEAVAVQPTCVIAPESLRDELRARHPRVRWTGQGLLVPAALGRAGQAAFEVELTREALEARRDSSLHGHEGGVGPIVKPAVTCPDLRWWVSVTGDSELVVAAEGQRPWPDDSAWSDLPTVHRERLR